MVKNAIVALLLLVSSSAQALELTGGPADTLPEGGGCTVSGTIGKGSGQTYTCEITSPGSFVDVYFGFANNAVANGLAMDGSGPSGFEIFRYSSSTPSSIVYTSTTTIDNLLGSSAEDVNTRLVLTLTSGTGTVIDTGGSPANNNNGDIQKLFRITSNTFAVHVDMSSNKLSIPVFGPSNSNVFDPTHTPTNVQSMAGLDLAFYWNECAPVNIVQAGMLTSTNHPSPTDCLQASTDSGSIIRNNSNFNLHWQTDGDLVLNDATGQGVWHSGTSGQGSQFCFESNGALVIRDSSGGAVFGPTTAGGELMTLGEDCNLTVVNAGGTVLFQSGTNCSSATFTPTPSTTPTMTPTPTSTATTTPTATRTGTATRTETPSATVTHTSTPSHTPIPTSTPSHTPIPTSTPSQTPIPTSTPTQTLVPTSTPSQTPVPSETPTETSIPTPTQTPIPTSTPTQTSIPTATSTETPISTATPSETPIPTLTPSQTAAATATSSETAVQTATGSATPTETSEPSQSATASSTPSPTVTPTHTATSTPT